MKPKSEIVPLFSGKGIFLTGVTGFVGKLLLHQILMKCDPERVYILIRPKKNISPKERLEKQMTNVVFQKLRDAKPNFLDKIKLVEGDLSERDLGITDEARQEIIENVNIVIHSGATVRFIENLKEATRINVGGTLAVMQLAKQLNNLMSCVHVSTAYAHCPYKTIEEKFYEPPIHYKELLKITDSIDAEKIDVLTNRILGEWPNTYTFTKAVAEEIIREYAEEYKLPVSVHRPSIIVSTRGEPVGGWVDNFYGPIAIAMGASLGIVRVIPLPRTIEARVVPGDMVANSIIALAYATSLKKNNTKVPVVNFSSSRKNTITWRFLIDVGLKYGLECPSVKSIWAHSLLCVNLFWFPFFSFLMHLVPALLVDIVLLISFKKPRILKLYMKGMSYLDTVIYFILTDFKFNDDNLLELFKNLNVTDQKLFDFNMEKLDWEKYLYDCIKQGRLCLLNDPPETIPEGIKRYKRQRLIEKVVAVILFGLIFWQFTNYMLKFI